MVNPVFLEIYLIKLKTVYKTHCMRVTIGPSAIWNDIHLPVCTPGQ